MPSRRPLLGAIGKHVVFFDGIDDYAIVPHSDSLNLGDGEFTIMVTAYVDPNATTGGGRLVSKFYGPPYPFTMGVVYDTLQITNVMHDGTTFATCQTPENVINKGEWFHATLVVDTQQKIYVNGELKATADRVYATSTEPITIGQRGDDMFYFYGKIAQILIYNRALSDDEIAQIYKALKNWEQDIPVTDGLVLGLTPHSLDCENGIWNDISGNNNNAILYGARCLWI